MGFSVYGFKRSELLDKGEPMRTTTLLVALALPALAVADGGGVTLTTYTFESAAAPVDLGTLGGAFSVANDINDGGDIVGAARHSDGRRHAFVYLDGTMHSIHTGSIFPFDDAEAFGINNDRIVVGQFKEANSPYHSRAFYYYPGIWLWEFAHHDPYGLGFDWQSSARAINRHDRIAGQVTRIENYDLPVPQPLGAACYNELPVTWFNAGDYPDVLFCAADSDNDGVYEDSGTVPIAYDINDSGNMVGGDGLKSQYSMFLWKNNTHHAVPAPAGMGVSGRYGRAYGINNKNQVVGTYGLDSDDQTTTNTRAFYWNGTSPDSQSLDVLPGGNVSQAYEINEVSIVAGSSERMHGSTKRTHAIIWHPQFGMKQLPALASTTINGISVPNECHAYSLNNRKSTGLVQVVGKCKNSNGYFRAVRWNVQIKATTIVF
jgi:probable HAF family extracellular repeat protein